MAYFSDNMIDLLWNKAKVENGYDPNKWRKDFAGAWIQRDQYGLSGVMAPFGWSIDHLKPIILGGSDAINNLMPIHWKNNMVKSNHYPEFKTAVTSEGDKNVERERLWKAI